MKNILEIVRLCHADLAYLSDTFIYKDHLKKYGLKELKPDAYTSFEKLRAADFRKLAILNHEYMTSLPF